MRFAKREASDAEKIRQWVAEHRFSGLEYDWLAVDRHGHVAVFSTAGSGPVPAEAIRSVAEVDAAFDQVALLPVIGIAENVVLDDADANRADWHAFSAKGFYAYDWDPRVDGPYRHVCTPSVCVTIGQLSAEIQTAARLAEFDVDFSCEAEIIWYEYVEPLSP